MEQYHERLITEKEKMRELERLSRQEGKLKQELDELESKEFRLKKQLDEEKIDVEKLEGFSLEGVFLSVFGRKEEKLEQEKREVLAAQLKWTEAKEARQDTEEELIDLRKRMQSLGDPTQRYNELLMERQNQLVENNHEAGERGIALLEKIADLQADQKEINEAIHAGKQAQSTLSRAIQALEKARNWGTVDMFGGGLISTSIKHSNIDTAKNHVHRAQSLLRTFARELDDIGHTFHADVSISGGLTFMDYFFDGLISDWLVQDQINNSMDQVQQMNRKTGRTLEQLNRLESDTGQTIQQLRVEWEKLMSAEK
ncbi:hypothetical protein NC661_07025 [Aquibacillus koreensis]|uniref:Uncharacterized protein n=1 Tax=Aquibacillus koreensis TaxID=279446 RepID=A0A9X3WK58_9BACI|nr:hypothetical protein [Aquibacillus koreensis]MCT2535595.1 hypothetical protein [Aquibacillus koreensis]MDC3420120.1 hypothetical protein [Aquibacillus koreensis]